VFPKLGNVKITRNTLTYVIVAFDLAICFLFIINTGWIQYYIEKEEAKIDYENVDLTDFTVRIRNLPPQSEFGSLAALRVHLTKHIIDIVKAEPHVIA
jgi:uncharacterized tellurite resistance protein B-like protein